MTGLVHPLEDVLGGLVESQPVPVLSAADPDGWRWMLMIVAAIGLLAIFTR